MSWKFEPSDFDTGNHPISTYEYMATAANRKLQEWIAASPVVYGRVDGNFGWYDRECDHGGGLVNHIRESTHRARLIMIEEIAKDTAESLLKEFTTLWDRDDDPDIEALLIRARDLLEKK